MRSPRVFISYAHESGDIRERVAVLARRLRDEGVDAWIDLFVEDDPPYWPNWMIDQIEAADHVLCVVSSAYRERFESRDRVMPGRGVNWEGLVMTEATYADLPAAHRKFIAVVFEPDDLAHVPRVLLGAGRTAYVIDRDYERLYRRLTAQPRLVPAVGSVRPLDDPPAHPPGVAPTLRPRVDVRSRPPFVPTLFLDRTRETALLRNVILERQRGVVVITGRAGVGKTALIGRFLQDLESRHDGGPLTFVYVSADGSVPISPDLVRTHLRDARSDGDGSEADATTVLVIDHAERLLGDDGDWCSAELGTYFAALATRSAFHLIIASRRAPVAFAGVPQRRIAMTKGLPDEDARQLLLAADEEADLGLAEAPAVIDAFVECTGGNPRALELIAVALVSDPLLEPDRLARDLMAVPDIAAQLLSDVYERLDDPARQIIATLAVVGSVVPIDILREALPAIPSLERDLRQLAEHEVIKYDRVNRRVRLDPFDSQYATRQLLEPGDVPALHREIAEAAARVVERGTLVGTEADTWAVAAVEHWLNAGDVASAAAALELFQFRSLQRHGLYDQIARLRRRMLGHPAEPIGNRVGLLRVLSLQGDFRSARQIARASDSAIRQASDPQLAARWDLEVATVERDSGESAAALRRFQRVLGPEVEPAVRARAFTAAAQLARRRDQIDRSDRWLKQALTVIETLSEQSGFDRRTEALALHQLAMNARFQRRHETAVELVERAYALSEALEYRGGLAYRQSLRAALASDRFELDAAKDALVLALSTYDEIGDEWGAASATAALATVEADLGSYEPATAHANAAMALARKTGNVRVQGLLPSVHLLIERRSGRLRADTRSLVVRACDFLARSDHQLYARRVEADLRLHDFVMGAQANGTGSVEHAIEHVLQLARPLAASPPVCRLPDGLATDVARVAERR